MKADKAVLIISKVFRPNIGGAETHINDLCQYLRKRGNFVYVLTYTPLTTKAKAPLIEKDINIEIIRVPWFGYNWYHCLEKYPAILFIYLFFGLFIASFWFCLFKHKKIEVIHAQGYLSGAIAKILKKIFKKRAVITLHALFGPIYNLDKHLLLRSIFKNILISFDEIVCLANKSKDELVDMGIEERKVKVCTHWVDLDKFKPLDKQGCRKKLGLEDKFTVLFVGRMIKVKGVELLLEAAASFSEDVDFIFIGEGPLSEKVRERSSVLNNIKFLGNVDNKDMPNYYNAADLLVVPSAYEELFGRVAIEALACGLPVVASNKGSLPEIINPRVGKVVEPEEGKILEAIEYFYENQEELIKMKNFCREYAVNNFSENNAEVILKAYK